MQSAGVHGHAIPTEGRCVWEWSQQVLSSPQRLLGLLMGLHCFPVPAARLTAPPG